MKAYEQILTTIRTALNIPLLTYSIFHWLKWPCITHCTRFYVKWCLWCIGYVLDPWLFHVRLLVNNVVPAQMESFACTNSQLSKQIYIGSLRSFSEVIDLSQMEKDYYSYYLQ